MGHRWMGLWSILVSGTLIACSVGPGGLESGGPPSARPATSSPSPVVTPAITDPPAPLATASPEPLPSDLDPDLADAIRLRRDYGLRSDLAYVREVAADPRSTTDAYGVPVYPEEFTDVQTRFGASEKLVRLVQTYAHTNVEAFGGAYIDEGSRTGVVSLWTTDLAEHAATLRERAGPAARMAFLPARYPEHELRTIQDEVGHDWNADWVAAIPAQYTRVGTDIRAGQVVISLSSAVPEAVDIVAAHYDLGDRLRIESDGTGAALLPVGWVDGRIVTPNGRPATNLYLEWESPVPGTCGGGDMAFGPNDEGRFELPCQVGERTIRVMRRSSDDEDGWVEVGRATVDVPADGRVSVTIEVTAP